MRCLVAACALLLLGACATTQNGPNGVADRDPREGFNRAIWDFNQGVDGIVVKPVTQVYRAATPRPARRGISRIFANLAEPFSAINNLLQGKPDRALNNLGRFIINTTIGVGGLADHATDLGVEPAPEDFGQTLATWGVGDGGYLVLPLLGPSTLRDGVGTAVRQVGDPARLAIAEYSSLSNTERLGITALEIIDIRATLIESGVDVLLETSADPYAVARAAYFERREAAIIDRESRIPEVGTNPAVIEEDDGFDAAIDDMIGPEDEAPVAPQEAPLPDQPLPEPEN